MGVLPPCPHEDLRALRPEVRLGAVWRFVRCRDCWIRFLGRVVRVGESDRTRGFRLFAEEEAVLARVWRFAFCTGDRVTAFEGVLRFATGGGSIETPTCIRAGPAAATVGVN